MIVLLAAIALRSVVWNALDLLFQGRYETLLALACAAALGKLLGGVLADRLGWRRYTVSALMLAAPLLALGNPALLLPGVALLQSATPAALAALARQLPRAPATAAGLGLGLAIAIGGLPILGGLGPPLASPAGALALCLCAAGAMFVALRRRAHALATGDYGHDHSPG
jgi:FSR family fosmidomycin resistance protein-like MFS transporter